MGDRVVVTGIGVISPFGVGRDAFWDGLAQGRLGVSPRPGLEALPEAYRSRSSTSRRSLRSWSSAPRGTAVNRRSNSPSW